MIGASSLGEGTSIQNEKSIIREYFKSSLALFVQHLCICYSNSIDRSGILQVFVMHSQQFWIFCHLNVKPHDKMKHRKVVLKYLSELQKTNKKKRRLIKFHCSNCLVQVLLIWKLSEQAKCLDFIWEGFSRLKIFFFKRLNLLGLPGCALCVFSLQGTHAVC